MYRVTCVLGGGHGALLVLSAQERALRGLRRAPFLARAQVDTVRVDGLRHAQ